MTENYHLFPLNDRAVINISGPDATRFLQNIITTDIEEISHENMLPGALLSPQGKVLFDFLIGYGNGLFFIDIRNTIANALIERLNLYKLRANIKIHEKKCVIVHIFQKNAINFKSHQGKQNDNTLIFNDKRITKGFGVIRMYHIKNQEEATTNDRRNWDIIRIENGIAESGIDFELGDVFPHDINYDQINGLSFKKGCYIGQEIVSRMQHRSMIARKRVLIAEGNSSLPLVGSTIEAKGKPIGMLGTVVGKKAIAIARIDRIKALVNACIPITSHGVLLTFSLPNNVRFTLSES
ncbi:MAG: Folate-binding protein [Candidatus Tokpelaia sp. JSC188]|nr:MAG: Folate-binding protein [Candidatus Tokpelaia sp. JSC188]